MLLSLLSRFLPAKRNFRFATPACCEPLEERRLLTTTYFEMYDEFESWSVPNQPQWDPARDFYYLYVDPYTTSRTLTIEGMDAHQELYIWISAYDVNSTGAPNTLTVSNVGEINLGQGTSKVIAHTGSSISLSFESSGLQMGEEIRISEVIVSNMNPFVSIHKSFDGWEDPDLNNPNGGPKPVKFVVTRDPVSGSDPYPGSLAVDFHLEDITTTGDDYTDPGTSVTIPAGQPWAVLEITPENDDVLESTESLRAVLNAKPGFYDFYSPTNPPPSAVGSIEDNDRVDLVLDGRSELEENSPGALFGLGASTLTTMALNVPEIEGSGEVTLAIPSGVDKVLVWDSPTSGPAGTQLIGGDQIQPLTWPAGSEPETLYVQAVGITNALASIQFVLSAQLTAGTLPASRATDTANGANEGALLQVGGVNKTDKTTAVLVGQYINPQVVVSNPKQAAVIYKWVEPAGETFKSYDPTAATTQLKPVPGDDLDDASLSFYYADVGQNAVDCTLTLGGKDYTVKTTFDVQKPASSLTATQGAVRLGGVGPGGAASFGLMSGPNSAEGMLFTANVDNVPNFAAGRWQFTQIVRKVGRTYTDTDENRWREKKNGLSGLDGVFKYQTPDPYATGSGPHPEQDNVRTATANRMLITMDEAFAMHVMYLPPGANSAWVPLRVMEWDYSGTAQLINGVWSVVNSNEGFTPSAPTSVHPQWERVITGEQWEQILD